MPREYKAHFDNDYVIVTLPDKLSKADVDNLEQYFALLIQQAKRRVAQLPHPAKLHSCHSK